MYSVLIKSLAVVPIVALCTCRPTRVVLSLPCWLWPRYPFHSQLWSHCHDQPLAVMFPTPRLSGVQINPWEPCDCWISINNQFWRQLLTANNSLIKVVRLVVDDMNQSNYQCLAWWKHTLNHLDDHSWTHFPTKWVGPVVYLTWAASKTQRQ